MCDNDHHSNLFTLQSNFLTYNHSHYANHYANIVPRAHLLPFIIMLTFQPTTSLHHHNFFKAPTTFASLFLGVVFFIFSLSSNMAFHLHSHTFFTHASLLSLTTFPCNFFFTQLFHIHGFCFQIPYIGLLTRIPNIT